MTKPAVRIGVGTRLIYDGELADVVELHPAESGVDLTLRIGTDRQRAVRIGVRELLDGGRARLIDDDLDSDDQTDPANVILGGLPDAGQVHGRGVRGRRVILRLRGSGGQCRGGGLLFGRGVVDGL